MTSIFVSLLHQRNAAEVTESRTVLVTGATGTLGTLVVAALLQRDDVIVVAPVRARHSDDAVEVSVEREFSFLTEQPDPEWKDRLHQIPLPLGVDDPAQPDPLGELDWAVEQYGVSEIVHCAGCLSYFDEDALRAINIEMSQRFVNSAKRWGLKRFVHISTAFSSGFVDGPILETLHDEPEVDPTFYTTSKRQGEQIVTESGVPYLIVRPSIVIGDSRDGHYSGPRYGLYQLWSGVERFLLNEWAQDLHYVAPERAIPLLHQDAFQSGFIAAWQHLADDSIVHLSSRGGPNVRELAESFVHSHLRPGTVHYYDRFDQVALNAIPSAQRSFLGMAAINIEISSRPWAFDMSTLTGLIEAGAEFVDASVESVELCQRAYFERSKRLRRYKEKFGSSFPAKTAVFG